MNTSASGFPPPLLPVEQGNAEMLSRHFSARPAVPVLDDVAEATVTHVARFERLTTQIVDGHVALARALAPLAQRLPPDENMALLRALQKTGDHLEQMLETYISFLGDFSAWYQVAATATSSPPPEKPKPHHSKLKAESPPPPATRRTAKPPAAAHKRRTKGESAS